MKLICLGDSLTYGFGVRHSKCWPSLVAQSTGWDVSNCGLNGDTTGGMLSRFNSMSFKIDPSTVVFLMGGANDIFYCGNTDVARASMGALIQQAMATGALVVVGIPMNIGRGFYPEDWSRAVDFAGARQLMEEYRGWLKRFCEAFKVKYVDFAENWDESHMIDGLHPDEEGHAIMAKEVIRCLNSII